MDLVCKSCQNPISQTYFFCPYCGKKLRQPPLSTSVGKQIGIYFVAIFFPIFSIVPAIRYLGQSDNNSKAVGIVTLLLTGISILLNVYGIIYLSEQFNKIYNDPLSIGNLPIESGVLDSLKSL